MGLKRVDWADALDEDAYRTGLRMTGAPKATKCNCEKNGIECCIVCHNANKNHVVDPRVYEFCACLKGTIENEVLSRRLRVNGTLLVKKTSVRCTDESTPRTEPYAVYANCPIAPSDTSSKRKRAGKSTDEQRLLLRGKDDRSFTTRMSRASCVAI